MIVLLTGAGMTVVGTWLVAYRQARQEQRFVSLGASYLAEPGADGGR